MLKARLKPAKAARKRKRIPALAWEIERKWGQCTVHLCACVRCVCGGFCGCRCGCGCECVDCDTTTNECARTANDYNNDNNNNNGNDELAVNVDEDNRQ